MKVLLKVCKRLIGMIVTILIVASFTFFLVRIIPGDPVQAKYLALIAQGITPYQASIQVRDLFGFLPKMPLWQQYIHYMLGLLHFNLGQSITYTGASVTSILSSALPWTVGLVSVGIIVSFVLGVATGVIAAVKRSSKVGNVVTWGSTFLHSIPNYLLGVLLIFLFSTLWHLLPVGSPYDASQKPGLNIPFLASLARHLVLPIGTYVISAYGGWTLSMKSSVISVLGDDFILASELRGIQPRIIWRYIARNAFLPLFTGLAITLGFMFGGSALIETVFNIHGLGYLLTTSTGALDYPLMEGCFLLITISVIVANAVADVVYTVIDPRVRG